MDILKTLLEVTIYSGLIFGVIMLFKAIFKKSLSPFLQYILWAVFILRLCIPVSIPGVNVVNYTVSSSYEENLNAPLVFEQGLATSNQNFSSTANNFLQEQGSADFTAKSTQLSTVQKEVSPVFKTITVGEILIMTWLLGIFISAMLLLAGTIRCKEQLKHNYVLASGELLKIYHQCLRELNIKSHINLYVAINVTSPALLISFRPKILMPLNFNMTTEQIKFALIHELIHYKRRDYLIIMLMRLLETVYWFNPFVWISGKQIVRDMETACDNKVVKNFSKETKDSYAHTILNMMCQSKNTVLGMAMGNTKKIAQKRIQGIYMNSRSKPGVKAIAIVVVCLMVFAFFTTACSPTFKAAPSITESPKKTVPLSPSPTPENSPTQEILPETTYEKINETIKVKDNRTTLHINADFIKPAKDKFTSYSVEIKDFTEEDIQKAVDIFMKDELLYEPVAKTKAELKKELAYLEEALKEYENEDINDAYYKQTSYDINELKKAIEKAPVDIVKLPAEISFKEEISYLGGVESGIEQYLEEPIVYDKFEGWAENDVGGYEKIYCTNNENNILTYDSGKISSSRTDYTNKMVYLIKPEETQINDNLTFDDALALAKNTAMQMDESFVYTSSWAETLVDTVLTADESYDYELIDEMAKKTQPTHYVFNFQRVLDGVPITQEDEFGYITGDSYMPINFENIAILVDSTGISSVTIINNYSNINAISEANIIPLEDAIKSFEEHAYKLHNNYDNAEIESDTDIFDDPYLNRINNAFLDGIDYYIAEIQIGLTRVTDETGRHTLVPVYEFYGNKETMQDNSVSKTNWYNGYKKSSVCTVNAIDGSIINKSNNLFQT